MFPYTTSINLLIMIILLQNSIHQNGSLVSIFPLKHLNLKKLSTFHNGKSFISSEKMSLNLLKYYCKFIETINHSQNFVFKIFRLTILFRTTLEAKILGDPKVVLLLNLQSLQKSNHPPLKTTKIWGVW